MDDGFVPFEPRRQSLPACETPEYSENETEAALDAHEVVLSVETQTSSAIDPPSLASDDPLIECAGCRARRASDSIDPDLLRAAAIRLAAAACSRALRYAIGGNPRLITRFVDDALAAAGSAAWHATVRVAPEHKAMLAPDLCIETDASLDVGDVAIETAAGRVFATLDERAELLVRASAP